MLTTQEIRNAPVTDEQAAPIGDAVEMENKFMEHIRETGVTRRAMFAVLATDVRKLTQNLQDDQSGAEALLNLVECLNVEKQWLEAHMEFMKTAQARLLYALSHVFEDEEGEQ